MRRLAVVLVPVTLWVVSVAACGGGDDTGGAADAGATLDGAATATKDATVDGSPGESDASLAPDVDRDAAPDAGDAASADSDGASDAAADAAPSPVTLTVTALGDGAGTVTLDPPGGSYAPGTAVTVTEAATSGVFVGWQGGGCSGTSACVVTLDASTAVSAVFGHSYTVDYSGKLDDYTVKQQVEGIPVACAYDDGTASGTLTLRLARLAGGVVTGSASASNSCDAIAADDPLACDSLQTFCQDVSGAITGNLTSFTAALTAMPFTSDQVTFTGAVGASVTGTLSFSVYPDGATLPTKGTASMLTLTAR